MFHFPINLLSLLFQFVYLVQKCFFLFQLKHIFWLFPVFCSLICSTSTLVFTSYQLLSHFHKKQQERITYFCIYGVTETRYFKRNRCLSLFLPNPYIYHTIWGDDICSTNFAVSKCLHLSYTFDGSLQVFLIVKREERIEGPSVRHWLSCIIKTHIQANIMFEEIR